MKKIILALTAAFVLAQPAHAQVQSFPMVTANGTASGAYSNMPIDTFNYPWAQTVSVTFTAAGSSSNRTVFECSNDPTFAGGGTGSSPSLADYRYIGTPSLQSLGVSSIQITTNRTYLFPIYARYCRLAEAIYASGTDTALVSLVASSSGPTVVDQGSSVAGSGANWGVYSGPYPGPTTTTSAANPVTGSSTCTVGACTATLAGNASRTTHICGFAVSAAGGTATIAPVSVATLIGGNSFQYQTLFSATAAATNNPFVQNFTPCIPTTAVNTSITVTTTADGSATAVSVNAWGFQF